MIPIRVHLGWTASAGHITRLLGYSVTACIFASAWLQAKRRCKAQQHIFTTRRYPVNQTSREQEDGTLLFHTREEVDPPALVVDYEGPSGVPQAGVVLPRLVPRAEHLRVELGGRSADLDLSLYHIYHIYHIYLSHLSKSRFLLHTQYFLHDFTSNVIEFYDFV